MNLPVQLSQNASEATSLGTAIAGGVGVGMFSSFEAANSLIKNGNTYNPIPENNKIYHQQMDRFKLLYKHIKDITFQT
jgi:xylulokinase